MSQDQMKSRRTQAVISTAAYIPIVLAVLVGVNWLANRHNKTYDATANKRFSISDQTEKAIRNLKAETTISYYDDSTNFRQAKDLLDRYEGINEKLKIEYVDINKKPQVVREKGIRSKGMMLVEAGDKREEAKSVTEEEITGAIIRLSKGKERMVCFIEGSGERELDSDRPDSYQATKAYLERNTYKTKAISLLTKAEVPGDCVVVVAAGPQNAYPEAIVATLKTFVENGGRLMVMLDPPFKGKNEVNENAKLRELLVSWGVTLNGDLVIDTSGAGQMVGLSEAAPLAVKYEGHPIVRDMGRTAAVFPLTQSLTAKAEGKSTAQALFSTSGDSFSTKNFGSTISGKGPNDKDGPFALGAAASYNTGQPNKEGRLIVTGTSMWASSQILGAPLGNRNLFINMMNWLSSDEELISIRPKDQDDRRLTLTAQQATGIKVTSQFIIPLLAVVAGIFVWMKRR
jgi:ABC-type uncharacterized transport system involved in gliding motility auxiliary subunit